MPTIMCDTPMTAMLRIFGASALALAVLLGARGASAEPRCADYNEISRQLERRHAEEPISLGLSSAGKVVQVFSTIDGATWTMVVTEPDGKSCVIAAGTYWQHLPKPSAGPEA